jgi:cytochrome d ubiquinol oxidase subunit I
VGDVTSKMVAQTQPAKLAAMEGLFQTTRYAPLTIFGWPDPTTGRVYFGLQINDLLSLLAYDNISHPVKGLNAFPVSLRPDTQIIHPLYDTMVAIGFAVAFLTFWFWFQYFRHHRTVPNGRWTLLGLVAAGPLAFMAIEFGWAVTELGRQPYIVYGYMLVKDGVQTAPGLDVSFPIFAILYVILGIASVVFLIRLAREKKDAPTPKVEIGQRIVRAEERGEAAPEHPEPAR